MTNNLFWDIINGAEPKGVDDYFIGSDEKGLFVAKLRVGQGKEIACIDVERPKESETSIHYVKWLRWIPPLSRWVGRIKAAMVFVCLKDLQKAPEEEIIAFRVAEKLSGTSYPPSEAN